MFSELYSFHSRKNKNIFLTDHSIPAMMLYLIWKGVQDPVHYQKGYSLMEHNSQAHMGFRGWRQKLLTFLLRLPFTGTETSSDGCLNVSSLLISLPHSFSTALSPHPLYLTTPPTYTPGAILPLCHVERKASDSIKCERQSRASLS